MLEVLEEEDEEDYTFEPIGKYEFSEEAKEDFAEVRTGPTGRAAIFAPEVLLIRKRKQEEEKKKANVRPTLDIFAEAIFKLYPEAHEKGRVILEFILNNPPRNIDDLDPYVLVVAADLRMTYPKGFDIESGTPGTYVGNFRDPTKLSYEVMASDAVSNLARGILLEYEEIDANIQTIDKVKADILSYYLMF